MDSILQNIKDPSWWFTAVFVAILASLLAAYLRDFVGKIFSKISTNYKIKRDSAKLESEARIDMLAADSTLLIVEFIKAAVVIIGAFIVLTIFTTLFIGLSAVDKSNMAARYPLVIIYLFTGGALIPIMYIAEKKISTATSAIQKYRINKQISESNDEVDRTI